MHHSTFIGHLASIYNPTTYVELGLYHGETITQVQPFAKKIYGVDIKQNDYIESLRRFSNIDINYTSTDAFFESFTGTIDMAFIDADHCLESAQRDFDNVLCRLNPGGIIMLHDTDPEEDRLFDPQFCGDSYKIVSILENRDDINVITIPIREAGLTIVTKKNDTRTLRRHL
jgi:predicted O-methyltransferase YrrM